MAQLDHHPSHSREALLHLLQPPVLRLHLLLLSLVVLLKLVLQELKVAELIQVLRNGEESEEGCQALRPFFPSLSPAPFGALGCT